MDRIRPLLEIIIAARYLRGQKRAVLFNQATRLSFLFMTLMVYIIVLVLSIFEGFQNEVQDSIWRSGYHITISRAPARQPMADYLQIISRLVENDQKYKRFLSVFGGISVNGLLEWRNRFEGKLIRAIAVTEPDLRNGKLPNYPHLVHYNLYYMNKYSGGDYILVGREMARYYGWQLGDRVKLYLPRGAVYRRNPDIRNRYFTVAGFFRTGFYEFDMNLILMSLKSAQRIMKLNDQATEIIVQLNNPARMDQTVGEVRDLIEGSKVQNKYRIETLVEKRGNFLAALQLEKIFMIILMGLLILAGTAGIWVTVHSLVKSKTTSIGMLRAIGMPASSVTALFTVNSMMIGFLSVVTGGSFGMFAARNLERIMQLAENFANSLCDLLFQNCKPVVLIPRNIYYFDHLPVSVNIGVIFGIALATLILSGLAGYLPARRAAALDPVRTLRND